MRGLIITLFTVWIHCFSLMGQRAEGVSVSGTVYISSSRSQGILNGKTFYEGEGRFRNQPIYFSNDTVQVQSVTDSAGVFHTVLKPGAYNVYQEGYVKGHSRGLITFGSGFIRITGNDEAFGIHLHNTANGRQAISNKGVPGNGSRNTTPVKTKKQ